MEKHIMKHGLTLTLGLAAALALLAPERAAAQPACIGACTTGGALCGSDDGCTAGTCDGACSPPAAFPADDAFTPIECADPTAIPSQDSCSDESRDHRNIVGGGTQPAYQYAQDGTYLYLRLRLEHDPRQDTALRAFAWGFGLDADSDGEFDAYVTAIGQGNSDRLEIQDQDASNGLSQQLVLGGGSQPDTSLKPVDTTGASTWVEVRPTTDGNFCVDDTSSTTDFFLTVAVPLTVLSDFGALGGLVSYGGSSSEFSGIQNDFVCVDGNPTPCSTGADCPSGICLETGDCAPPTVPFFIGCVDSTAAGIDSGCTSALPHCLTTGGLAQCFECLGTDECDDLNDCTTDACVANTCAETELPPGTDCTGGVCNGSGTTPMCVACVDDAAGIAEDSGCGGGTPLCDVSGTAPVCVACLADDTGCGGATPICDRTGTPICVSCNLDAQCDDTNECTGDACVAGSCVLTPLVGAPCTGGICGGDPTAPVCIDCVDDSIGGTDTGCDDPGRPFCDTTGVPTCVECLGSGNCGDADVCTSDLCVLGTCANPPAPTGTPCAGGVCNGTTPAMCVACVDDTAGTDTGCGGDTPFCDERGSAPICVECLSGLDCGDGNECTNDACTAGVCGSVAIVAGVPCSTGVCNGDAGAPLCIVCVDNAGAGATDSGCSIATPYCDDTTASPVCVACEGPDDCDDGNDCTTDACTAGACVATSLTAGTECAGGVCDGEDTDPLCITCVDDAPGTDTDSGCLAGAPVCQVRDGVPVCTGCTEDTDCDDGDECTDDACSADVCVNTVEPAGTPCTDGVCDGVSDPAPSCGACIDDETGLDTDTGCAGDTPLCDTTGADPVCVACLDDADCSDGNECTTDTCTAGACSIAPVSAGTECSVGVCDGASTPACVACVDDAEGASLDSGCGTSAPLCDESGDAPVCVLCLDGGDEGIDLGCAAPDEVCAIAGAARACVDCADTETGTGLDFGCAEGAPICGTVDEAPQCVECTGDSECPGGEVCNVVMGTCEMGCRNDDDCSGETPVCDINAEMCVECVDDGDCSGRTTCGDGSVCRFPDSDGDGVDDDIDLDDDNDGIPDEDELGGMDRSVDSDGDGVQDFEDPDAVSCSDGDEDGICDVIASSVDFDGDGVPNHLDLDADGDGLTDLREGGGTDGNRDGTVDGLTDLDGNGLDDRLMANPLPLPNTDRAGGPDFLDLDADGDGLSDVREANGVDANGDGEQDGTPNGRGIVSTVLAGGALPGPDTNGDGTPDWQDPDSDGDDVPDSTEGTDADHDGQPDREPSGTDANGNGWDDEFDGSADGTAPEEPDTNDDGLPDWRDPDDDGDGIDTTDEDANGDGDPTNDDSDEDGTPDYLDPNVELPRTGGFSGGALCSASPRSDGIALAWLLALAAVIAVRRRRKG